MRPSLPPSLLTKGVMASSSPCRAEKLPTPGFTRLLRGNGGSRSRGRTLSASRSRSFNSATAAPSINADEEAEPSSPTVTCIGQVRIRKKKQKVSGSDGSDPKRKQKIRCRYLERSLLCNIFCLRRRNSDCGMPRRSIWPDWALGFRFKGNAKNRLRKEPIHTNPEEPALIRPRILGDKGRRIVAESDEDVQENGLEDYEEEVMGFLPSEPTMPPKNALILMRSRSAPHNRFSDSPVPALDGNGESNGEEEGEEGSRLENQESCDEEEGEEGRRVAVRNAWSYCSSTGKKEEEARCPYSSPLFLKRCKSEPTRKAARLASLVSNGCGGESSVSAGRRQPANPVKNSLF